jgi:hypothetical protein
MPPMSQEQSHHQSSLEQPSLKQPPFKIGTFRTHPLNQIPLPPPIKPNHNLQYVNVKSKVLLEYRK